METSEPYVKKFKKQKGGQNLNSIEDISKSSQMGYSINVNTSTDTSNTNNKQIHDKEFSKFNTKIRENTYRKL